MEKFIIKEDITFYPGITVTKETNIEYKNEKVKQTIKDLELHSIIKEKTEKYKSKSDLTIYLEEGEKLLFDDERGYYLPALPLTTVKEQLEELECVKEA